MAFDQTLIFRITTEERQSLEAEANARKIKISALLRERVFGKKDVLQSKSAATKKAVSYRRFTEPGELLRK